MLLKVKPKTLHRIFWITAQLDRLDSEAFQRPKDPIYEFIYFQAKYTVLRYVMSEQITIPCIHYEAVVTEEMENKNKNNITRM